MRAMAKKRGYGNQHGQDGHGQRDRKNQGIFAVFAVMCVDFEFSHSGRSSLGCGDQVRLSCAAFIANSISDWVWETETNDASNCEGARKTPRSSMFRKY